MKKVGIMLLVFSAVIGELRGEWKWANPKPHGNNIISMAYRDGVIWQVGDRGRVYTSTDLDFWTARASGTSQSLRAITFFRDKVVISGANGTIVQGTSPQTLTPFNIRTTNWLEGIAASSNEVVAVGDNGAIYRSVDAASWTKIGSFTTWLRGIAYGDERFVAAGDDGFLISSPNGENWSTGPAVGSAHLNGVVYFKDRFWVVGDNGAFFTNTPTYGWNKIELGITNNLYTAVGNTNDVVVAGDGVIVLGDLTAATWKVQTNNVPVWPYYSSVWDERLFLVGGRSGLQVEGFRTNSTAEINWFTEPQPTRSWLWSVTRTPEFYAAAGANGTIVTSENGVNWERETTPSGVQSEILLGIGGNTNVLVAVGSSGSIVYSPNVIATLTLTNAEGEVITKTGSAFGILWKEVLPRLTTSSLQGIAANDSVFVAGGGLGTLLSSFDGSNWVARLSPTTNMISSITAHPGGFLAAGDLGTILRSADGTLWSAENSGVTNWIYSVRYLNGKFYGVGEAGLIIGSDDGTSWERYSSPSTKWLNDITWQSGKYFIVADDGAALTSPNGTSWQMEPMLTNRSIYSVAAHSGQVVAVGTEGTILRKQLVPFTTPVNFVSYARVEDINTFLFHGVPGQTFELQSVPAFPGSWRLEAELEILRADGTLIYQYRDSPGEQFFRTVSQP